jgi:hypothetical protein
MKTKYKRVEIKTEKDIAYVEKLVSMGWEIYSSSIFSYYLLKRGA